MKYLIKHKKEFVITIAVFLAIFYILFDGIKRGAACESVLESIAIVLGWYYNMPTSIENCEATGEMRQRKAEQKDDYKGEKFYE